MPRRAQRCSTAFDDFLAQFTPDAAISRREPLDVAGEHPGVAAAMRISLAFVHPFPLHV